MTLHGLCILLVLVAVLIFVAYDCQLFLIP